jgi:tRNA G10  N-methylase Trm11
MPNFNDLNLSDWKNSGIWTDSLWIIPERDKTGKHSGFYHGNFVPQIPRQMILRYSRKNDIVFDPFVGSGTSAFEAETLGRNFIGVDIQPKIIDYVKSKVDNKNYFSELIVGDSSSEKTLNQIVNFLEKKQRNGVQLAILHPPYADIVKFSEYEEDLSNCKDLKDFLSKFSQVAKNTVKILDKNRYLAVVIGDKYTKGQWIPLGFYCMNEIQKLGLTLKSVIIKNMEGNRAKQNKEAIWKYRALSSDYYIFKHEYILIFKNEKQSIQGRVNAA